MEVRPHGNCVAMFLEHCQAGARRRAFFGLAPLRFAGVFGSGAPSERRALFSEPLSVGSSMLQVLPVEGG